MYYDPTDYFDITQHEVDRQDELEYEVGAVCQSEAVSRVLIPDVLHLFCSSGGGAVQESAAGQTGPDRLLQDR